MKAKVMKRAWEIYRTLEGDRTAKLSVAMKQAWFEVKRDAVKARYADRQRRESDAGYCKGKMLEAIAAGDKDSKRRWELNWIKAVRKTAGNGMEYYKQRVTAVFYKDSIFVYGDVHNQADVLKKNGFAWCSEKRAYTKEITPNADKYAELERLYADVTCAVWVQYKD